MASQGSDSPFSCPHCSRLFTHKSSLIRHSKRCFLGLRAPSRQKSCRNCSNAKAGCDLQRPICGRCQARSLDCVFVTTNGNPGSIHQGESSLPASNQREASSSLTNHHHHHHHDYLAPLSLGVEEGMEDITTPQFSISPERCQILLGTAPGAPNCDAAVRHTMHFVIRFLKSWPRLLAVHNFVHLPPIIHMLQVKHSLPKPLANCHALASMWATHTPGSSILVQNTILQEVGNLLEQHHTFPELDMLAAAQSLLMLLTVLFFGFEHAPAVAHPKDAELLIAVWDVKHNLAATGLYLEEESMHSLPTWEQWALVSAKRRTILALNHLEWAWSLAHGYPVLTCFELAPLPAPTAGYLWRETNEHTWEQLYSNWLRQWSGGAFKMMEFLHINPGGKLNERSEMWLAEADEYGIMLMAEVNAVGSPDVAAFTRN